MCLIRPVIIGSRSDRPDFIRDGVFLKTKVLNLKFEVSDLDDSTATNVVTA